MARPAGGDPGGDHRDGEEHGAVGEGQRPLPPESEPHRRPVMRWDSIDTSPAQRVKLGKPDAPGKTVVASWWFLSRTSPLYAHASMTVWFELIGVLLRVDGTHLYPMRKAIRVYADVTHYAGSFSAHDPGTTWRGISDVECVEVGCESDAGPCHAGIGFNHRRDNDVVSLIRRRRTAAIGRMLPQSGRTLSQQLC